jgi:nucleotide-binding universal stress UspA family protein
MRCFIWGGLVRQMTGGDLHLITVVKRKKDRAKAEALLTEIKTEQESADHHINTRVRVGKTVKEIQRAVKKEDYDLLIIGVLKQPGLVKQILTPKTKRILSKSSCPVLIARGEPQQIQSLLVCESGRKPSLLNRLLSRISPILENIAQLTVLHVMSQIPARPGVPGWELRAEADELIQKHTLEGQWLEKDLSRLERYNADLEAKVRHGLVIDEILTEAHSGAYDLVVVGVHQAEGMQRYLLDDLTYILASQIDRPLLVV